MFELVVELFLDLVELLRGEGSEVDCVEGWVRFVLVKGDGRGMERGTLLGFGCHF